MNRLIPAALVVIAAACGGVGGGQRPKKPIDSAIAGLVRDGASGGAIGRADIEVMGPDAQKYATESDPGSGLYVIDHLKPGRYTLHAEFAGQPVTISNIEIVAGEAMYIDVTFTLGSVEPIKIDYSASPNAEITRYHPPTGAPLVEGTVSDTKTRMRVAGAVVTAIGPSNDTLQTISDDHGRFKFAPVTPGTYTVSAYYSVGGRGQIEIRRSDIHVDATEGVVVPLWIDMTRR